MRTFKWFTAIAVAVSGLVIALSNSADAQVKKGKVIDVKTIPGQKKATKPSTPSKRALIVLIENGGISSSLEAILGDEMPKVKVATCGKFTFDLKKGESIPQLLGRVAGQIKNNAECLNPAKWKIKDVPYKPWLDKITDFTLESMSTAIVKLKSSKVYDKVIVLDDKRFSGAGIRSELKPLAANFVVDIHVLSHGGKNVIVGYKGAKVDAATFFNPLAKEIKAGLPLHLRSIYQMNCVSGTMVDDWQKVGAEVVNGTAGAKNDYMPTQYFHFVEAWVGGKTFKQATDIGYNNAKTYWQPLYQGINHPEFVTDSKLFVTGDGGLKVSSMPK